MGIVKKTILIVRVRCEGGPSPRRLERIAREQGRSGARWEAGGACPGARAPRRPAGTTAPRIWASFGVPPLGAGGRVRTARALVARATLRSACGWLPGVDRRRQPDVRAVACGPRGMRTSRC